MFALFLIGLVAALFFIEKALSIRAGQSKKSRAVATTRVSSPRRAR